MSQPVTLLPVYLTQNLVLLSSKQLNRVKILFIAPTDAHYYKIIQMLKHLKL